ncbi:hypothetical protein N7516_002523 [Penicillium verrucosum]|uniref:uncharacterized protein n=1 Tax=Penicillium verrucosum TaxID=60171 RepID=UPI0025452A01|nr:uncharacterized protein N7516_002523 [Penicillium verrucosum]KAJ5942355.1 hypothetical protein N7516_002523 [Penicillium verrucosum]
MSEVQKTVEETPAVVPAVETAVETPATEAAVETPKETTEAAEPTATPAVESTEAAEPVKEEVKPATEGVLGYKAPGLVKGFRFAKRFFYFNEEAVESKQLSVFHQNEKAAVANPTAAWASQTGKGLLFLTKRAEDKATPAGIFNLADVSDVTKEGTSEFLFKVAGQKHTFQASSAAERDSWVVAIEAQATEAKAEKETITSSEGYKAELEKLTKPAVAVAAAKKPEEKKEDKKEEETPAVAAEAAQEEPKEEPKEEKKEKAAAKSRSQSRKRTSIFGSLLGKKDAEEKKEETPAAGETKAAEPAAEPSVEAPAPVVAESTEAAAPAPVEVAEPTTETPAETTEAAKEEAKDEKKAEKKAKRASIFGNFFQKVASPSQEKSEKEATAPATEETPVASTAPQLENPVEEATAKPTEAEAAVSSPKEKRRTSFFGNLGMKKEKKADSDNEVTDGEAKETKAKKLGGLFRKPSKAVKLDKEEVAAAETEAKADAAEEAPAVPAKETATENAPVVEAPKAVETTEETKNVNVATATPVQAAA